MKLRSLHLAGFGRLANARFDFADGLTVVYGPNEAGKSTVAAAIVASLYGLPRGQKEDRRPWTGESYATTLVYELADGRRFEVRRDYQRDAKGVHVYDRDGNDVAAQLAVGKTIAPGESHLRIPYEAFINASCVLQQSVAIDNARSGGAIATALAQALDGGPKEDAALGAVERLNAARRQFVGTPRATVNTPLRALREQLAGREAAAEQVRGTRDRLAEVREQRAVATTERARIVSRRSAAEREARALRAAELNERLEQLHEYREEWAVRHAERTRYDDVATFAVDKIPDLEHAYFAWDAAENAACNADDDAGAARLNVDEAAELTVRNADEALEDVAFAALHEAAQQAEAARAKATAAANEAAATRRDGSGGRSISGAMLAVAMVSMLAAIALAIAHSWALTEVVAPIAALALAIVVLRIRDRMRRIRVAERKQQVADDALATERAAASAVAAVLDRLGVASVDELARRRDRHAELLRRSEQCERSAERAGAAREEERRLAAAFDALADELVPDALASRAVRRQVAYERAGRRRQRDGIDNAMAMLALRRNEILRGTDEFTLIAQRDALAAAGIIPADVYVAARAQELEGIIQTFDREAHAADITIAELTRELELGEAAVADLAMLEEEVELRRTEIARLEAFDRALVLAATTIERLAHEAHQAFARRLETYAAEALAGITAGRYGEIRVDPATLAVRVRVPETGAIVDLDALSAGTRDQVYLIVRFAMARMFGEGLETPPLLLDDPFAYWDEARIERCLPLVAQNAFAAQTILFTSSAELAAAAAAIGAVRIDLAAVAAPT